MVTHKAKLLDAAKAYAELGWKVFPVAYTKDADCRCPRAGCNSPGKHPAFKDWQEHSSNDPSVVQEWFESETFNIGLDCGASRLVVIDIDDGGRDWFDQRLEEHGSGWRETVEARTGGGGIHLVFLAPHGVSIKNSVSRLAPHVDVRAEGGLIVVAPSAHSSGKRYQWVEGGSPLEMEPLPLPDWLLEEIQALAHLSAASSSRETTNSGDLRSIPEGRRNDTLFHLAQLLSSGGQSPEEVLFFVSLVNEESAKPPLDRQEVEGLVASATSARKSREHPKILLLSLEELDALPSPEWLVEGLLPANSIALLTGEPGVGKSFVALSLGLAVAAGTSWLGREVRQGAVVYFALEGATGYPKRIKAWRQTHDMEAAFAGEFRLAQQAPGFAEDETAARILDALAEADIRPSLVIVDTLARAIAGADENSASDMSSLVRTLDTVKHATNATILIAHHPPKNGNSIYRGSSALFGSLDTAISLKKSSGGVVAVTCEKQKDGVPFERFTVKLEEVPEAGSCVIVPTDFYVDIRPETPKQMEIAEDLVRRYLATGEGVRFTDLRVVASSHTLTDALKRFAEEQQVVKTEDGRYVPSHLLIARFRDDAPELAAA